MQAGIRPGPLSTVIHNAPDPAVFHPAEGYIPPSGNQKIRLVSTSWSVNPLKGFSSFVWLDENLDFSRFEVTLIGNCPERFRHVRVVPPLVHSALGDELRRHHLFFFPSRVECCSNALLEGLHCGLPALAFDGSSNRELVGEGGRMFARDEDIPGLLGEMSARLSEYRLRIAAMPLSRVAGAYASFLLETVPDALRGKRLKSAIWSKQVLFKGGVLLSKVRAKMS
ncbi:MAG TPA: glycosyltransferase [Nitratidesulfovibrio sp.]|nr:glycosyltransferase [Nitratidesulfovibrio sp.]